MTMCKEHAPFFCPGCDRQFDVHSFQVVDPDKRPRCCNCGRLLVDCRHPLLGPEGREVIGPVLGFLARALIGAGLLAALRAREADTPDPDFARSCQTAHILLREAARL